MIRFFLIFLIVFQVLGCEEKIKELDNEIKITIYSKKKKIEIKREDRYFEKILFESKKLLEECEKNYFFLTPSGKELNYKVAKKMIKIYGAIEIDCPEAVQIKIEKLKSIVNVKNLIIPIIPEEVHKFKTRALIFCKEDPKQKSGFQTMWYINSNGLDDLRAILKKMGIESSYKEKFEKRKKEIVLTVYNKGKKFEVPKNSIFFNNIIEECEKNFFQSYMNYSADQCGGCTIPKIYKSVKKKKENEIGIEINYPEPKEFNIFNYNYKIEKLFVPIEEPNVDYFGEVDYFVFFRLAEINNEFFEKKEKHLWRAFLTKNNVNKIKELLSNIGIRVPKSKRYFNKGEEKLVKIKVYNKGKEIKIDKNSKHFKEILDISDEITSKAIDNSPIIFDSLGSKETNYANLKEVEEIKISGVGVDIIYPKTKICETEEKDIGFYELFISFKKFYGYNQYPIIFTKIKYPQIGFFQKLLLKFYYHQPIYKEEDIWKSYTAIYDLSKLEKTLQNFGIKILEKELDKSKIKVKIYKNGKEEEILSDDYKFLKILKSIEDAFFDSHIISEANEVENFEEVKKIKEGGEGIWVSYPEPRVFCRFLASKITEIFIPFKIFERKDGKHFLIYAKYYNTELFDPYLMKDMFYKEKLEKKSWIKFDNIYEDKLYKIKNEFLKNRIHNF